MSRRLYWVGGDVMYLGKAVVLKRLSGRAAKHKVNELLHSIDIEKAIEELCRFPLRGVINPLFSFLYHGDPRLKWHAVTAMGEVTAKLADEDMESARVIVRRLMWNLNDESGGIGWGSPEAMGEILTRHESLANEYHQILISYAREDGNFQEDERMQQGILWGIGRLSQKRPDLIKDHAPFLMHFLSSPNAAIRGLAAWIMGHLAVEEARSGLERLLKDGNEFQIYLDHRVVTCKVKDMAKNTLEKLSRKIASGTYDDVYGDGEK